MDEVLPLAADLVHIHRTGRSTHPDPDVRAAREQMVRRADARRHTPLTPEQRGYIVGLLHRGAAS